MREEKRAAAEAAREAEAAAVAAAEKRMRRGAAAFAGRAFGLAAAARAAMANAEECGMRERYVCLHWRNRDAHEIRPAATGCPRRTFGTTW